LAEWLKLTFPEHRPGNNINISATATGQQAVVCDEETCKRLIELREKIAATGMPCLSFFCKANCSRLGSVLESSSEGGAGYLWSIVIMKAGRKQAGQASAAASS